MVEISQDQREGNPVWQLDAGPNASPLSKDLNTEVLVIGAGTTGAFVAQALAADGRAVTLVDKNPPGTASTAASTSLLLFEIDTPLLVLAEQIGAERAARAWRRSHDSMRRLAEKVTALGIACDFAARDALQLPGNVLSPNGLEKECEARQALGLPSRVMPREELLREFGIDRPLAMLSGNSAEAHPQRLAHGLLTAACAQGARVFAPEEIVSLEAGPKRVTAQTSSGHRIAAELVVFCGGYDLPPFVRQPSHKIVSTWAAATKPQPENLWPSRALIWEAAKPYLYIRTTPEGRLLIGGEDENHNDPARRAARIPAKLERFRNQLRLLLPKIEFDVEYAWAGAFGASDTGLPTIGNVPGMPRVCAVLGFGGNGTTYAQIAAEMISRAMRGEAEPDIDLFAFGSH